MSENRTPQQQQAITEVENFLKSQTANARRSNKTYRGIDKALSAAQATTGQFAEYASDAEKELATEFFTAFERGGRKEVFRLAPNWR